MPTRYCFPFYNAARVTLLSSVDLHALFQMMMLERVIVGCAVSATGDYLSLNTFYRSANGTRSIRFLGVFGRPLRAMCTASLG